MNLLAIKGTEGQKEYIQDRLSLYILHVYCMVFATSTSKDRDRRSHLYITLLAACPSAWVFIVLVRACVVGALACAFVYTITGTARAGCGCDRITAVALVAGLSFAGIRSAVWSRQCICKVGV